MSNVQRIQVGKPVVGQMPSIATSAETELNFLNTMPHESLYYTERTKRMEQLSQTHTNIKGKLCFKFDYIHKIFMSYRWNASAVWQS